MRHRAPGAGSASQRGGRPLAGIACALALALPAAVEGARPLVAERAYDGGRVVRQTDAFAMPQPMPGGMPYRQFVAPVSLAAAPGIFYVADAGLGAVFRYDTRTDLMAPVAGIVANSHTRLAIAPDRSLVVTEGRGPARRFFPDQRPPQFLRSAFPGVSYDVVAVDGARGAIYGLDIVQRRIEQIQPIGTGTTVFDWALVPPGINGLAAGNGVLYATSPDCACVLALDTLGPPRAWRAVAAGFGRVVALAAHEDWLAIIDGGERRLVVLKAGNPHLDIALAELGLIDPQSLAIRDGELYVADPAARRVVRYRLWP